METENPLSVVSKLTAPSPTPNYDTEILQPLKAIQDKAAADKAVADAQAAAMAAQEAASVKVVQTPVYSAPNIPAGSVQAIIVKWANAYGVSADWLLRVANCESGYNPTAVNHNYYAGGGNPSGIFQFLPQTFYGNAIKAGLVNADYWSPDDQAHVAAYMFSIGQSGQWECR